MSLLRDEVNEKEDAQSGKYLEFMIKEEAYGIEIRYVTEIISMQPVNTLPEAPDYIKGVINLRGRIIPVIDMRQRLNKKETVYSDRTCIVVIENEKLSAGLIADKVSEVLKIEETDIAPPPDLSIPGANNFLSGIGKVNNEVKLLLNCEKLFNCSEANAIHDLSEGVEI